MDPRRIENFFRLMAPLALISILAPIAEGQPEPPPAPPAVDVNRIPPAEAQPGAEEEKVFGYEKDPFNPEGQAEDAAAPEEGELSLELQTQPDGVFVAITDFLKVLSSISPGARGEWDGLLGVFRINVGARSLQALSSQPVLIVDGKYQTVQKPIRVKGATVLLPVETVKVLLKVLGFELEIPTPAAPAMPEAEPGVAPPAAPPGAAPTPMAQARPALPTMPAAATPAPQADAITPDDLNPDGPRGLGAGSLLASVGTGPAPAIDLAEAAGAGGLTWAQLADAQHRGQPRRVTLLCDPPLAELAARAEQYIARALGAAGTVIAVDSRRDDSELLASVTRSQPELALDLMLAHPSGGDGTPAEAEIEIWAVHEALWPARGAGRALPARSVQQFYRLHQFHNLALAATLKSELARSFPGRAVRSELSPSFVLRRVDAPSASVLIPADLAGDPALADQAARAIAAGVIAYARALASAGR